MQLQHNNVDMALEWLLSNPEEPSEAITEAPAAPPATEIAQSFPDMPEQPEASDSKPQVYSPALDIGFCIDIGF